MFNDATDMRKRIADAMTSLAYKNGAQPFQNFGNLGMQQQQLKRTQPVAPPTMAQPMPLSLAPPVPPGAMPPQPMGAAANPLADAVRASSANAAAPGGAAPTAAPTPSISNDPSNSAPYGFKDSPAYMGEGSVANNNYNVPDLFKMWQQRQPQQLAMNGRSSGAIY